MLYPEFLQQKATLLQEEAPVEKKWEGRWGWTAMGHCMVSAAWAVAVCSSMEGMCGGLNAGWWWHGWYEPSPGHRRHRGGEMVECTRERCAVEAQQVGRIITEV